MPRIIYKNKKGMKLPSVTTVIHQNLGWGKEPLHYYWWKQGIYVATKMIQEDISADENNFESCNYLEYAEGIRTSVNWRQPLQVAAQIGTAAHDKIDCEHKEIKFVSENYDLTPNDWDAAYRCYDAWERWRKQSKLKIIESETSLISEEHQFGGTLDAYVAEVNDALSILDLKTCDGVYDTHKIQLVAYGKLWEENNIGERIEQYHIIQIKKNGAFIHHNWIAKDLEKCWDAFKLLRKLHDMKDGIKKL